MMRVCRPPTMMVWALTMFVVQQGRTEASPCTLCLEEVGMPSMTFLNKVAYTDPSTDATLTCQELYLRAASYGDEDSDSCYDLRVIGASECGCPPPAEAACSLCADGSAPSVATQDTVATGSDYTCRELQNLAALSQTAEQCASFHILGARSCGCPPLTGGACSSRGLCADGSALLEEMANVVAVTGGADGGPTLTCGQLDSTVGSPLVTDESVCDGFHAIGAASCGCMNPRDVVVEPLAQDATTTPSCTLCRDGTIPSETDLETPLWFDAETGRQVRCLDYLLMASVTEDPDSCRDIQAVAAVQCGCPAPPAQDVDACRLCYPGLTPADTLSPSTDFSCTDLAAMASVYDKDDEKCRAFQITAGVYCGCQVLASPSATDICRLCPGNKLLPDPGRPVSFNGAGEESCASLEWKANSAKISLTECSIYQAEYALGCGCAQEPQSPQDDAPTVEGEDTASGSAFPCRTAEDKPMAFFSVFRAVKGQTRDCAWLWSGNPHRMQWYCENSAKTRKACPATCGKCAPAQLSDGPMEGCSDKPDATFVLQRPIVKDCHWLASRRSRKIKKYCKQSPGAVKKCAATCHGCNTHPGAGTVVDLVENGLIR